MLPSFQMVPFVLSTDMNYKLLCFLWPSYFLPTIVSHSFWCLCKLTAGVQRCEYDYCVRVMVIGNMPNRVPLNPRPRDISSFVQPHQCTQDYLSGLSRRITMCLKYKICRFIPTKTVTPIMTIYTTVKLGKVILLTSFGIEDPNRAQYGNAILLRGLRSLHLTNENESWQMVLWAYVVSKCYQWYDHIYHSYIRKTYLVGGFSYRGTEHDSIVMPFHVWH